MVKKIYSKIIKIKKIGHKNVYDIIMKRNHNFLLSNGVLSHNSETKGCVEGSADFVILGKLPSENDRVYATQQLYKDNFITKKQIQDLAVLNPGEYYFCEVSKKVKKRYLFLPRTMFWKPGMANFFTTIWSNTVNKWQSTKDDIAKLIEIQDKEILVVRDKELIKKLEKDSKRKSKKIKIETEDTEDTEDDEEEDNGDIDENIEKVTVRRSSKLKKVRDITVSDDGKVTDIIKEVPDDIPFDEPDVEKLNNIQEEILVEANEKENKKINKEQNNDILGENDLW